MKKLILSIAIGLVGMSAYAQETLGGVLPMVNSKVNYTGIVKVDSVTKKIELYQRSKLWFVEVFKSANDVIQLDDKENGVIVGKGFFKTTWVLNEYITITANIQMTITINTKDGRYRYELSDFKVIDTWKEGSNNYDFPLEEWTVETPYNDALAPIFYKKIDDNIKLILLSLDNKLKTPTIAQNNNW